MTTLHTSHHPADAPPTLLAARPRRSIAALGSALAAVALGPHAVALAGDARAEPEPPPIPAETIALSYSDGFGPGQLTVTPLSADAATGGTAVFVHLAQARGPFGGTGFLRPVAGGYVIATALTGVAGVPGGSSESYFLSGTLTRQDAGWRGHGRWSAISDPLQTGEWHVAEWPAIQPPRPQLTTVVRLDPIGLSGVTGATTLVALPDGETRFELPLSGLTHGSIYALQLRAGTPTQPSASFTQVVAVTADQRGRAGAVGLVRFRGTEPIALLDLASADHYLSVVSAGQTVAAGPIPALQPLG